MSDLGRFRQGDLVPLAALVVGASGDPATPDAAPVASVALAGVGVVASVELALAPGGPYSSFALPLPLGGGFALGRYTVSYSYAVGGVSGSASDTFDVIPGGDIGGAVISLYSYVRPEATYVVAQLASGNIVQGRNPTI